MKQSKKEIISEEAKYGKACHIIESNKKLLNFEDGLDELRLMVGPRKLTRYLNEHSKPAEIFTKKEQARIFNKQQPIFYDKSGMFWIWDVDKKYWEIADEVDVLNLIEEQTGKDIISPKSRTKIINSLKQEGRKNIPKPIKPTWIQFKDKIYDIKTGKSFEAMPDYFVTNPIDWEVSGISDTPVMDKIFKEWVGSEYVQTLYEIISYSLLPSYPLHRLFCFIGAGLNGKSCFLKLLKRFIGEKNTAATELDRLIGSRFEVTRLHKKLVCLMGETNFTEMRQTALIKTLTGEDEIPFEYKNKTPFNDTNYAKLIIATNNLPTTTDKTIGWYRRWLIIDFSNSFTEKKDILEEIPEEEYNNLATNSLIVLNNLLKNREFYNEGDIENRIKRYEDRSNPIEKFINEYCIEDLEGDITKKQFMERLNEWCKTNKYRTMSDVVIGKKLKELGYLGARKYVDWLYDGKGGQIRVWKGLLWKND